MKVISSSYLIDIKRITHDKKMSHVVKRYNLTDVLAGNKTLFNVNNLWGNEDRPDDYESKQQLGNTCNWIDLFHNNVHTLSLDKKDLTWMQEAFKIGCITGTFPKMYEDELNDTCENTNTNFLHY